MTEGARSSTAALRNRDPILAILRQELPPSGLLLEIASGSGEHAVHFAAALPSLRFQPSDADPRALASIRAHAAVRSLPNLLPPLALDASEPRSWPLDRADAMLAINLAHISPMAATEGLFAGAGCLLPAGAPLLLYGPFIRPDAPLEPSNQAFDADLRSRNPLWGLRRLDDLDRIARRHGLAPTAVHPMPASNLTLVFRRRPAGAPPA